MSILLNTYTTVDIVDELITIMTSYLEDADSDTLYAFISDSVQVVDSVDFIEGELGIRMTDNYPEDINYEIDDDGNLIVISDDAAQYSISEDGYLVYTYPIESTVVEDEGTFVPLPEPTPAPISSLLTLSIVGLNANASKYLNGK